MADTIDTTNPDDAELPDEYIQYRCGIVEDVTIQTCGITRSHFRSVVARNIEHLPGRTGLPERQTIEAALTLLATALKFKMLNEDTITRDPIGWAGCKWVSLTA
jgi:hypothetical protein